ncbi:hypothetical protein D3C81_989880 [compost metagenome]
MGDENKGDPQLALQLFQFALHLFTQLEVQRAQRFVQQQHPRSVHQRAGQCDPLALATGKMRRLTLGHETQRHAVQRLLCSCQPFTFGDALHHQSIGDVFQYRHVREQGVILEYGIHVALVRR